MLQLPAWLLQRLLVERASVLLISQRAVPIRAATGGYRFRFTNLKEAIHDLVH